MKNHLLETIYQVNQLKDWFVMFSGVEKKHEAYKIWSRWLITHKSLSSPAIQHILPMDNLSSDLQIEIELQQKGASKKHARLHYLTLQKIIKQLHITSIRNYRDLYQLPISISVDDLVQISLPDSNYQYTLSKMQYDQLVKRYDTPGSSQGPQMREFVNHAIWYLQTLYYLLDGKSLQWAVPPNVLNYLRRTFGCDTELFASPLNCYYSNYYSLFYFDRNFGSKGNFFTAPESDFKEGCYQVNPPFIDIIFQKTSQKIIRLLNYANRANRKLTFIYVLPDWEELHGYQLLITSRYCVKIVTIPADEHFYFYWNRHSYIRVHFNTKVVVMSTDSEVCPYNFERQLPKLFKNPNWV